MDISRNTEVRQIEEGLMRDLALAINKGEDGERDKVASKLSDILTVGSYTYGVSRTIYGELSGKAGKYHVLTSADTDKIKIENDKERLRIEMPVTPDIEQFMGETAPRKLRGEPYLETAAGRYVAGYFTRLKSPAIEKPVDLIEVYPYDFVEKMKESRQTSILKAEDFYWFMGNYKVIGECEDSMTGSSIRTTTVADWDAGAHVDIIELLKAHSSPIKMRQPRELLVMPESRYLDFGKIPATMLDNFATNFVKTGFSPEKSPMYNDSIRKKLISDYRALTFAPHNDRRSLFHFERDTALQTEMATLEFFGYNIREAGVLPVDRDTLATRLGERYGVTYEGSNDPDARSRSKFDRILVYAPLNYLGRVFLWKRDIRNHFKVANDTVSTYSDEKITYLFHNKYAITALDIWYDELDA